MTSAPAPREPAPGTPAHAVEVAGFQDCTRISREVVVGYGCNVPLARGIAEEVGAEVAWPFSTLGFIDPDYRTLAFVLHAFTGAGGEVEVTGVDCGLPWSRPILRVLCALVFAELQAASVVARVRVGEVRDRALLRRLGFVCEGREHRTGLEDRLVYRLRAEAVSRHALRRHRLVSVKGDR